MGCTGLCRRKKRRAVVPMDMSHAPIDRGYAWLVVVGCFIMNFITIGAYKSLGILFVEFLEEFRSSTAVTAWMAAIMGMLFSLGAPIANVLSVKFGHRKVIIVGGIIAAASPILTSFATNIVYIIFSYGFLMGAGVGLAYGPCIVMVSMYFEKRRALANGIAVAGSSVGQFVLPPLLRIMIDNLTYQGALLILGGLMMNIILAGALMRPLSYYARPIKDQHITESGIVSKTSPDLANTETQAHTESQKSGADIEMNFATAVTPIDETVNCEDFSKLKLIGDSSENPAQGSSPSPQLLKRIKKESGSSSGSPSQKRHETFLYASNLSIADAALQQMADQASKDEVGDLSDLEIKKPQYSLLCTCSTEIDNANPPLFECSLFRNPLFLVFVISALLGNFFYANQFLFIPPYCQDIGLSKDSQAMLMAIMGAADLVGRVFCGWFADLGIVKKVHIMSASMIVTGSIGLFVPLIKSFEGMAVYIAFVGAFGGTFVALLAVVLVDFVGIEKLSSGFGLTLMLFGTSSMVGPPFLGWLRDVTHSYDASFRICGVSILLGGVVILYESILDMVRTRNRTTSEQHNDNTEDQETKQVTDSLITNTTEQASKL